MDRKQTLERWRGYFEEISAVKFLCTSSEAAIRSPDQKTTLAETEAVLKETWPDQETYPDDVPANFWVSWF